MKDLKVAIVTEYMHAFGGADRIITSLITIFPSASLYAATYSSKEYPSIKNMVYTPKFFGTIFKTPVGKRLTFLQPLAFEQFDLRGYDLVVSISAGPSKGVLTMVDQPHIGIICTPPRHQWDKEINVRGSKLAGLYRFGSKFISNYMRIWDSTSISRVDHIISISNFIQKKVKRIYRRDSVVIYPGISSFWFDKPGEVVIERVKKEFSLPNNFHLVVSRLYDYKQVDDAIKACLDTGKNIVIAGAGPDRKYLEKLSMQYNNGGTSNIQFIGHTTDEQSRVLYNLADSLLFCGIEDYGLVPIEAMAAGCPVLALNKGGVTETVQDGRSGYLYNDLDSLTSMLKNEVWRKIDSKWCIMRAQKFTEKQYISELTAYINKVYEKKGLD